MKSVTNKYFLVWITLAASIIILDQVTKWIVVQHLHVHERIAVISGFFDWTLLYNKGVAFSMFHNGSEQQRWWLSAIAVCIVLFLLQWLRKLPATEKSMAIALSLIIGGALGNVFDRLRLGHVVDFILVYYHDWSWPAFNVADSAVVVGTILFALCSLKTTRQHDHEGI